MPDSPRQERRESEPPVLQRRDTEPFVVGPANGSIHALSFVPSSQGVGVTVSIGLACMGTDRHFDSAEALLASADEALYEAKVNGGNRVCLAGPA